MYFNLNLYKKAGLEPEELLLLILIQNKYYEEAKNSSTNLINLSATGYLEQIKGKKGEDPTMLYRLSQKGKNFLRDLEIKELTDESQGLAVALIDLYESNNLKDKVKNRKEVVRLISWFKSVTEFPDEQVLDTVADYIRNTSDRTYISGLGNLIWKPLNSYATKPSLEQSKLFNLLNA